jgi:hypothetical protein
MTRVLLLFILLLLGIYGAIEAWPLIAGPSLSVSSPEDNASFAGGTVAIAGRAERIASLTLDGEPLLRDEHGDFSAALTFPRGGSILTFIATDQFGRRVRVTRSIFVPYNL